MTDPEIKALLRSTLDEVKRSHAEINQIRRLAEAWITDSMELLATEWKTDLNEKEMKALAQSINSCGRAALSQLRPANAYTED